MLQISFEVSRNGQVTQLQENVDGNKISDLIKSLKAMKESSNNTLTKLLQEETIKNTRKAEKDNDTDDTEGEEPTKDEPRKKIKS
ncbi:AAEL008813-PA [Aedes aegypti]|uniref:AAEL008813-PA n=1 Tax=Aedes aegypti TaxID=7159 RepID=Q16XR3_AEDAE|nr:AAEL008813-PA [Aedes aegypti]